MFNLCNKLIQKVLFLELLGQTFLITFSVKSWGVPRAVKVRKLISDQLLTVDPHGVSEIGTDLKITRK